MRLFLAALAVGLFIAGMICLDIAAYGRELYPGQYAQVDPAVRQWFRSQTSPVNGGSCCSEADGVTAEEDIRDGHYWARFDAHGVAVGWMAIPDEVVIRAPNKNGAPVVWYWWQDGQIKIRCYAPGGGV